MTEETTFGKYILKEQLGRGGFGTIYRAEDTTLHVERAIKILHPQYNADPTFIERFRQEARTAARLEHPNIVPVIELGQHEGAFYLVMSLMPGGSMKDTLQNQGPLPVDRALESLEQIARGLDFAYNLPEKLIHRDIKPANILIDRNGSARVSDFGFAKALENSASLSLSASGGLIGTPTYMAPELWRGQPASRASDIYSLAAMFYEMLTGRMLFTGNSPAEVMTRHVIDGPKFDESWPQNVPAAMRPVLERGLSKDPEDRYSSAYGFFQAARDAFNAATGPQPAPDRPVEPAIAPQTPGPQPGEPQVAPSPAPMPSTESRPPTAPSQTPPAPILDSRQQAPTSPEPASRTGPDTPGAPGMRPPEPEHRAPPPPAPAPAGLLDRIIARLPKRKGPGDKEGKPVSRRTVIIAGCGGIAVGLACAVGAIIWLASSTFDDVITDLPTPTETQTKEIEVTPEVTVSVSPTPEEVLPPEDPRTLVICMGQEPESLYLYKDASFAASQVREAIFDGPIDFRSYRYQPVILSKLPNLDDGDAFFQEVSATRGDLIVDAYGDLVPLENGIEYLPSGCRSRMECSQFYPGSGTITLEQMVVNFSLLPGLLWSDGEPLTASDSVYSFKLASDPDSPNGKYIEERTESYEAVDDLTVVWTGLPGFRDETFASNFWTPMPEHYLGSLSAAELVEASESNITPIGWGPYVIDEWSPGDQIRLSKNGSYFRADEGLPKFDTLIFRFMEPGFGSAVEGLLKEACDVIDETMQIGSDDLEELLALENNGQMDAVIGASNLMEHLDFGIVPACFDNGGWANCTSQGRPDYFGDLRFRQAIAYCIDREALVNELFFGQAQVLNSIVPEDHPYFNPKVPTYPYDPELAMALMDEMGLSQGSDGIRTFPDGTRASFEYGTLSNYPHRLRMAEYIQAFLADCGIELKLQVYDDFSNDYLFGRNFELVQFGWISSSPVPPCELWVSGPTGGQNNTGFSDEYLDYLCLYALDLVPGEDVYADLHYEAQLLLMEELPIIPLFMYPDFAATRPDFCNFSLVSTDSSTWNIEAFDFGKSCTSD